MVNQIGAGDQSTLALGNLVSLTNPNYGSGNIGSLTGDMTKSWTTAAGTFTETLTSFIINRGTPDAITLLLAGTLTGPGGISQDAFAIVNANQVGGPGNAVNWSLTDTSTLGATPLPAALPLFATGLGALGLLASTQEAEGRSGRLIDQKYQTGFRRDRREAVFLFYASNARRQLATANCWWWGDCPYRIVGLHRNGWGSGRRRCRWNGYHRFLSSSRYR